MEDRVVITVNAFAFDGERVFSDSCIFATPNAVNRESFRRDLAAMLGPWFDSLKPIKKD